jgi:hypothetical protein
MAQNTVLMVTDVDGIPSPQYYHSVTGAYEYLNGAGNAIYTTLSPTTSHHTTATRGYEIQNRVRVQSVSGIVIGFNGTYKATDSRWLIIFDTASNPPSSTTVSMDQGLVEANSAGNERNGL